jgi:DNA-binding CsgD family transcriptional regulator
MVSDGQGTKTPHRPRVARTVAHVDLRSRAASADGLPVDPILLTLALDQVCQTVRADDRVCPYGVSRIAVEFGPAADAVTPRILGQRLARAVGQGVLDECAVATRRFQPADPVKGAGSRPPTNGHRVPRRLRSTIPSTTTVTVERIFDNTIGELPMAPLASSPATNGTAHDDERLMAPRLRQRAIVRYSPGGMAGAGTRRDDSARPGQAEGAMGTVLVIDPDPAAGSAPGLAATAAADLADRMGFVAGAIALSSDEGLIAEIGGRPLDLVVLVVGSESASEQADWATSTWSIPAKLTEAYHSKGIDVMVVSAGASVAALTGCLERGAFAAFELSAMRDVLLGLVADLELTGAAPTEGPNLRDLPPGAEGMLKLTGAERRVLFHLTTGRSPQTIANELVVSLATVRSHIRSVLHKLGVRSQLAAVALATSRALPPNQTTCATVGSADRDRPTDETVDGA